MKIEDFNSLWERVDLRTHLLLTRIRLTHSAAESLKENNIKAVDSRINELRRLKLTDQSIKQTPHSTN